MKTQVRFHSSGLTQNKSRVLAVAYQALTVPLASPPALASSPFTCLLPLGPPQHASATGPLHLLPSPYLFTLITQAQVHPSPSIGCSSVCCHGSG